MKTLLTSVLASVLMLCADAFAHTDLAKTQPKSGSELEASPPTIELQFQSAARLTSVVVAGSPERRLEFKASDKPNTFVIAQPELVAGRNEIKWKALSKDGHVVSGTLIFTIKHVAKPK